MATKVDLIVGKTMLAFAEAELLSVLEHKEAVDRITGLFVKRFNGRVGVEVQNQKVDISVVDDDEPSVEDSNNTTDKASDNTETETEKES